MSDATAASGSSTVETVLSTAHVEPSPPKDDKQPAADTPPYAVVLTNLPAAEVTEYDVEQYMTFCGPVESVFFFPGATPTSSTGAGGAATAHPNTAAALVFFKNASSVVFAEQQLSSRLFAGKVLQVRRATTAEVEGTTSLPSPKSPRADEPTATAPSQETALETMTGLYVRMRFQRAAQVMRAKAGDLLVGAHEQVAKVKQGAIALELRAAHAVADVRDPREPAPVYGNGPTCAQYDHTPTQPQWGEAPEWQRTFSVGQGSHYAATTPKQLQ